jgi:hypothetical protein
LVSILGPTRKPQWYLYEWISFFGVKMGNGRGKEMRRGMGKEMGKELGKDIRKQIG